MKKYWFCEKPAILVEAEKAQRKFHPVLLVVFYLLFGSFFVSYSALLPPRIFEVFSPNYIHFMRIFATVIYLVPFSLFLFFVRFVERRSWASMGVVRNKMLKIYLLLISILIVGGFVLSYFLNKQIPDSGESTLLMASDWVTQIISGFCFAIAAYGFLLISLTNRMSMKNAVLVVAFAIPVIGYIGNMGFIVTNAINMNPPDTGFWQVINLESSLLISSTLSTVTSIIFMASCALLLLRTSHIWSVAILVLAGIFITGSGSGFGLPFPFGSIVSIAIAAAILLAVLFWPKKTFENQEGAGVVSR